MPSFSKLEGSNAAVEVADVSKRFYLKGPRAGDLRELAGDWRDRALKRARDPEADNKREFWALRDVSFTVEPGHPVGIVGHNGSGKSTLLKMLTGILQPTGGRVRVAGRIGALIEVGAGFHPDLSGRENVYLNGSILGLSRREIDSKMDAIVEFSGLERFLDTPVKRYSSGMYMRLGFAVAAHTDPDVLLIDEVLAVGDTLFQRKCIRKLKDFISQGGTVIFVSHAMNQVAELCPTCVWLDRGQMRFHGPTEQAVDQYMAVMAEREEEEFKRTRPDEWLARETLLREQAEQEAEVERRREQERAEAEAAEQARLAEEERQREAARAAVIAWRASSAATIVTGITLRDVNGIEREQFQSGESLEIEVAYRFGRVLPCPAFCVEVFRKSDDLHLFTTSNFDHELRYRNLSGVGSVKLKVPFLSLNEGDYRLRVRIFSDWQVDDWAGAEVDRVDEVAVLRVQSGRFAHGCVYLPVEWQPESAAQIGSSSMEPVKAIG